VCLITLSGFCRPLPVCFFLCVHYLSSEVLAGMLRKAQSNAEQHKEKQVGKQNEVEKKSFLGAYRPLAASFLLPGEQQAETWCSFLQGVGAPSEFRAAPGWEARGTAAGRPGRGGGGHTASRSPAPDRGCHLLTPAGPGASRSRGTSSPSAFLLGDTQLGLRVL